MKLTGRPLSRLLLIFARLENGVRQLVRRKHPHEKTQLTNAEYHLSVAELRRLVYFASGQRDKLLIRLLVETGLRRSEASSLLRSDVNEEKNLIMVRNGKGNKTRHVPVSSEIARMLIAMSESEDGAIFRSRIGRSLSCRQVNRVVAVTGKRAGVSNPNPKYDAVTCHLLRHSFARHWKDSGGSIETLSKILGHSSVKTTWDQYGTQSLEDVRHNYRITINKMSVIPLQTEKDGSRAKVNFPSSY